MRASQYRWSPYGANYGNGAETKERAAKLLVFIEAYIQRTGGVPPSYREMQAGVGVKTISHVHRILTHLERAGRIRRLPDRARALEVVKRERYYVWDNEAKELVPLRRRQP